MMLEPLQRPLLQRFARELGVAATEFHNELQGISSSQRVVLAAGEGSYLYILGDAIRTFRAESQQPLRLETADRVAAVEAVVAARAP
jgi:hypothetical protein